MKKWILWIAMAAVLSGCVMGIEAPNNPAENKDGQIGEAADVTSPVLDESPRQGIIATHEEVPFEAVIFRTNAMADKQTYPDTVLIESQKDLENYLNQAKDRFDLSRLDVSAYDASFFNDYSLVLVLIEEPSGSITHEVTDVYINDGVMNFEIKRNVPEVGTTDMAQYHIAVAIRKSDLITTRFNVSLV